MFTHADDTLVYIELSQSDTHKSISSLSHCLTDISLWIKSSKLKLNSDKTEFIIIGTKQQRHKLSNHFPVKLLDNDINPSDSVSNVGVIFDSDFSFHKHVSKQANVSHSFRTTHYFSYRIKSAQWDRQQLQKGIGKLDKRFVRWQMKFHLGVC